MTANLVVLISGNGSNLQALIDAIRMKALDATIACVVSNRKAAFGLVRAEKAGIPTQYFPLKPYLDAGRTRAEYDADLAALVAGYKPDWVVLAGWMHILSAAFVERFPYRIVNLHPALPGKFPGAHAIEEAFAAFQRGEIKQTGCMVHLVPDEAVDAGPVIGTAEVPIYRTDTLEMLANRMHQAEHRLLVQSLQRLIVGDEEIEDEDE
ncbi:MAG TPA: phosphoribosylglycinamide formyltransferase [Chloroflexi bacterium]|nr:phosphoribosylglycinamide formyltransferase [Chloroflexota bacterium]